MCRWEIGALNQGADPANSSDVGWGVYDFTTHITYGKALFILNLPDNTQKKLWIQRLEGPRYTVRLANLDGSGDTTLIIDKGVAAGRNFVYLKLIPTPEVLTLEPTSTSWDIVFTPYMVILPGNVPYPVAGVLQNERVRAARVPLSSNANPDTLTPAAYSLDSCISTIGYDWKRYDMSSWALADTVYYLVRDNARALWRLRFVGFTGSSSGKVVFEKVLLQSPTALPRGTASALRVYPQPAQEGVWLDLPTEGPYRLALYSLTGQVAWAAEVSAGKHVYLPRPAGLAGGVYFLRAIGPAGVSGQLVTFE